MSHAMAAPDRWSVLLVEGMRRRPGNPEREREAGPGAGRAAAPRPFRPRIRSECRGRREDRATGSGERPRPRDQHLGPAAAGDGLERQVEDAEAERHPGRVGEAVDRRATPRPARRRGARPEPTSPSCRKKTAAARRTAPRRSPRPARTLRRATMAPPTRTRAEAPRKTRPPAIISGAPSGIARRPRPRPDPQEARRTPAVGSGFDAHDNARIFGMRAFPRRALGREAARGPAGVGSMEARDVEARLPEEIAPVRFGRRRRRVLAAREARWRAGPGGRADRPRPRPCRPRRRAGSRSVTLGIGNGPLSALSWDSGRWALAVRRSRSQSRERSPPSAP